MLEESDSSANSSPNTSEPPSPSLPATPILDELEDDDDTDWSERNTLYVKSQSPGIRIYSAGHEAASKINDNEGEQNV